MADNIFTEMNFALNRMKTTSESTRLAIHKYFAAFYENDYLLINEILKQETLNNPFSAETLNKIDFQHLNVTKKILNRLSSGIYTKPAIRELIISPAEGKNKAGTDEKLNPLLQRIRYPAKVKDSFRKALYYNCIIAMPVNVNGMLRLDIITPNNFAVEVDENDYLKISKLKVYKSHPDGTLYESIWTSDEHYIIEGSETYEPSKDNPNGINPYGIIPGVVLRIEEGCDFYGEPNWNLLINQKNLDIRLTDMNEAELRTVNGIWHGVNTKFKDNQRFGAGEFLQSTAADGEQITLEPKSLNIDYTQIRDNVDWKNKTVMNSEGLSAQSGDVTATNESGIKRMVDEIELQERRDDAKEILYDFEIELLKMIRIVQNKVSKERLNDKGIFEVTFSEEKPMESISDKVTRREMESSIGYYDLIDFTMQDLEISEEDAIQQLKERKERMKANGLETEKPKPEETQNV